MSLMTLKRSASTLRMAALPCTRRPVGSGPRAMRKVASSSKKLMMRSTSRALKAALILSSSSMLGPADVSIMGSLLSQGHSWATLCLARARCVKRAAVLSRPAEDARRKAMDFQYTPEQEAFRREVRGWLEVNLPAELCVDDPFDERVAPDRETFERRVTWQKKMAQARWVGISWPAEYGGRGASLMEQIIFDEEYFQARAPVLPGYSGVNMAGPTIIEWGTDEQKRRYLPRILSGEDIWCQGYSEPGAGSDLAGLATRAEDKGNHFVVNGQKVWTSGAHFADWIYLLVRSDPTAPRHKGISYLLVDMKTPGITVRPLVLMNGHRHFNEVFFVDVPVPKANLVGRQNEGWKPAMTTLMYERKSGGSRDHAAQIARLTELTKQFPSRQEPAWHESHIRQQLAQLAIDVK